MSDRWLRAAPALAALAYPALVALGPAVWPPLLVLALASPALALWVAIRLRDDRAPVARAIALAAVGAPALFSLLGGLLDWQRAIPLTSVRVWIPLWLALAALCWLARPRAAPADDETAASPRSGPPRLMRADDDVAPKRRLAIAHGVIALPIIAFALAHIANHLCGVAGGDVHEAVTSVLRRAYRHPVVEPMLLGCIALQVVTGLVLVARRLARRTSPIEVLQSAAGVYLVMFFASHLTAVLRRRGRGFDTNWEWLVSGDVLRDPWSARLAPYYVLGVVAVAVHLACAIRAVAIGHGARRDGWGWLIALAAGLAMAAGATIIIALAGSPP